MWRLARPPAAGIRRHLAREAERPFSYEAVGGTREGETGAPAGFSVLHHRALLGAGEDTFRRAVLGVRHWEMFRLDWVELCFPDAPVEVGTTVGVLARILGTWSLHACRIVYVIEESARVERFGFAYGTLPDHATRGEERFSVEWHRDEGEVWYDLLSFSRPGNPWSRSGSSYTRHLQRRFAAGSLRAMQRAAGAGEGDES